MAFLPHYRFPCSKWWAIVPFIFGLCSIAFSFYFISHSYDHHVQQYICEHGCFYKCSDWQKDFFTIKTKTNGNYYCLIGILFGASLALWSGLQLGKKNTSPHSIVLNLHINDGIWLISLLLFGLGLWLWGFFISLPAYDEVFSAVNCAGEGPLLSFTYYMLPNNHILFNVLNSVLFGWVGNYIISGRIISGLAYAGLIVLLYFWLRNKLKSRAFAALFCAVLMLQFPVWGFSFQARGYAIYLLCAWSSLILLEYYIERHNALALVIQAFACIVGFAIMPAFLFWYATILLIICGVFIYTKRIDKRLLVAHLLVLISIFIFYLPILAYSGLPSLTDNQYVAVAHSLWPDFWSNFISGLDATIRYCFASDIDGHKIIYPILFVTPIILLPFIKNVRASVYVVTGICLWLTFFLLQLKFRHYPFMRNMVAHCSLSLAILLISIHSVVTNLFSNNKLRLAAMSISVIFCVAFAVHFILYMKSAVRSGLYFYDTVGRYNDQLKLISCIPHQAHVWTSNESFFPRYLLKKKGFAVSHCYDQAQTFFIIDKTVPESLPISLPKLDVVDSADQYLLYRVK